MTPVPDRIALQNAEFDALEELMQRWKVLRETAVFDDSYPEVRHRYESSLTRFLTAVAANGRIELNGSNLRINGMTYVRQVDNGM